ncbi:MAG: hypothetical protein AAF399_25745 [Bacteroidota bacterium]
MTKLTTPNPADLARFDALIPSEARSEGCDTLALFFDWNDAKATRHLTRNVMTYKRLRRRPVPFLDDRGEPVFRVPLDDRGENHAIADAADWFAVQMTAYDGLWTGDDDGNGNIRVKTRRPMAKGRPLHDPMVARVILDLGAEAQVRYRNRDRLDLRRCNLDSTVANEASGRRPAKYRPSQAGKVSAQRRTACQRKGDDQ